MPPDDLVAKMIAAGALIHIRPDWHLPVGDICAVTPNPLLRARKVQVYGISCAMPFAAIG